MSEELVDGVTVAEVTRADGKVAPAIFVGSSHNVEILSEPLALAYDQIDQQRPYRRIVRLIASVSNLLRYYVNQGRPPLDYRELKKFLERYIVQRANGDPDFGWAPMSRNELEAQARNLSEYSDFCEREYGYFPLVGRPAVPLPRAGVARRSFHHLLALNERDLFSHLAIRRALKSSRIRVPGRSRRNAGAGSFFGMTEDFAWSLIEAERNSTYKAIWLLGFFGGPRLSEILNLWICDVLPGTWRHYWFGGDIFVDLPLVIVADPWISTWCGKPGDERTTREQYLQQHYGLPPRPMMAESDCGENRGRAAGFKGTKPTYGPGAMRQIFWAREEAAKLFEATIVRVVQTRNRLPQSRLHPFLFVNTDHRKPNVQGNMLSSSNVRKAFERAVRRLGETPYLAKKSPHGMRHLYKDMIKAATGGDAGAIQTCLGHRSRESQDEYGSLDMEALRHAMSSGSPRRNIS